MTSIGGQPCPGSPTLPAVASSVDLVTQIHRFHPTMPIGLLKKGETFSQAMAARKQPIAAGR